MAVTKARAENAKACWVTEELTAAAVARHKAVLAMAETAAEEAETEQVVGLPAKQKGRVEGEQLACHRCAMWGFDCQVSQMNFLFG